MCHIGSPTEGDRDLIWSVDFNAALRSRQIIRAQMVTQRVATASSQLAEIVEAVSKEERVEELHDEEESG